MFCWGYVIFYYFLCNNLYKRANVFTNPSVIYCGEVISRQSWQVTNTILIFQRYFFIILLLLKWGPETFRKICHAPRTIVVIANCAERILPAIEISILKIRWCAVTYSKITLCALFKSFCYGQYLVSTYSCWHTVRFLQCCGSGSYRILNPWLGDKIDSGIGLSTVNALEWT